MLLRTALHLILHGKAKLAGAVAGVTFATFLVLIQWGFYYGYRQDISVIFDSIEADIWIRPKGQPLFDGWTHIDDLAYWKIREAADVEAAARLVWGYVQTRVPKSGGKDGGQILGVEFDTGIQINLRTHRHDLGRRLRPDGHVLLGKKDRDKSGIGQTHVDGLELNGRHAEVVGFVEDVHLFTGAVFLLTDLENARAFLKLSPSETTYIVCRCRKGTNVQKVVADLQQAIPEHDVLTARDFHDECTQYWETRAGIGPVLLMPSVLAGLVGFIMVTLTLYISTIQKLPVYACMKALGASSLELVFVLIVQVLIVFSLGVTMAVACLWPVTLALQQTTVSLVISRNLMLGTLGTLLLCSMSGSLLSIWKVASLDPGKAFRV